MSMAYMPALMAVWSMALSLSRTTARVRIPIAVCEKFASDLGLGVGFRRELRFFSTSFNWLVTTKMNQNSKAYRTHHHCDCFRDPEHAVKGRGSKMKNGICSSQLIAKLVYISSNNRRNTQCSQ